MRMRRWHTGAVVVAAIAFAGCGGSSASPASEAVDAASTTSTSVAVIATSTSTTADVAEGQRCREYGGELSSLLGVAADLLGTLGEVSFAAADGELSLDEAAAEYRNLSVELRVIRAEIMALGEPPAEFTSSTALMLDALEMLSEGTEAAATGAETIDVPLINSGAEMIGQGTALVTAASDALSPCP